MFASFSPLLRSLTLTPATVAVDQAHRIAQRRLADGGAAPSLRSATNKKAEPLDFVLPADMDTLAVAKALRAKLGISTAVTRCIRWNVNSAARSFCAQGIARLGGADYA